MCKFCDENLINDDLQNQYESTIDFGIFGPYTVSATIWTGKIQIAIDNIECHDLFVGDIPIKYCPFCGRKLPDRSYIREGALMKLIDMQNEQ